MKGIRYCGMPYKGSKAQIARRIIESLPPAKHFYDLFGGGGSVAHAALLSGKYDFVHYNELDPVVCRGFESFCRGDFRHERRWISREEFYEVRNKDPYAHLVFSFGSNGRSYLYGPEFEPWKKAIHLAKLQRDFRLLDDMGIYLTDCTVDILKAHENDFKRLYLRWLRQHEPYGVELDYRKIEESPSWIFLETERRLNRLRNGGGELEKIIITNLDYRDVPIERDSVIYCDPPYRQGEGYHVNKISV